MNAESRKKHLLIMGNRKWFAKTFKVDVRKFYNDIFVGFDIISFDEYLQSVDENYWKANAGELGEDVDCSMAKHLRDKYGEEAEKLIFSFIGNA